MSFEVEVIELVGDEGLIPSGRLSGSAQGQLGSSRRDVYLLRARESVWVESC